MKDNLKLAQGSMEVLLKAVGWEWGDKKHHVFFETSARDGARLLLYKPCYSDRIHFLVWLNQKTPFAVRAKSAVTRGVWHHLIATWRHGEIALYIDGQLADRDAREEVIMPKQVGPTFTLGDKSWGQAREGTGRTLLDEFAIYSRTLSAGEVAKRYRALSAVKNTVTVSPATQPPKVNGYMSPGEWDRAACVTGFTSNTTGTMAERQTHVFLTYDQKKLYVAFRSIVRPGTALVANVKSHDGPIFQDDAIDLFLAPEASLKGPEPVYYHFAGNSAGISLEGRGANNQWSADWDYASNVAREVNAIGEWTTWWTAEAGIPFPELGVSAPRDGETWRVNFCRDWQNPKEYTAWSHAPSFHDTGTLGCLTFREKGPVVRLLSFGKLSQGKLDLKAEVVTPTGGKPAALSGHIQIRAADKTALEHSIPVQSKPGGAIPLHHTHDLKGKANGLVFSVAAHDSSMTYLHASVPFGRLDIDEHVAKMLLLPLSKKACQISLDIGVLPQRFKKPQAILSLIPAGKDEPIQTRTVDTFDGSIAQGSLDIRDLKVGRYTVAISLRDGRKEVYKKVLHFTKPPSPWLNSNAGVTDEVLPPWTPLEVDGTTVKCWGREYHLDSGMLPSRIVTRGAQILQSPMRLEVTLADGRSFRVNPALKAIKRNGTGSRVTFTGAARRETLDFTATSYIEFDGMMFFQIKVTPLSPTSVSRLTLVIPLKAEHTTLRHVLGHEVKKGVSSVGQQDGWQWYASIFRKCIWVGDEDLGLTWFMEHPSPWALMRGAEFTGLSRKGKRMRWHFNFIDSRTQVRRPGTMAFGLQATPVKPLPPKWRSWGIERSGNGTVWWTYARYMKYFGYPEASDPAYARAQVRKFHEQGQMVAPYVATQVHDENSPEFQYYGAEWRTPGGTRSKSKEGGFWSRHLNVCPGSKSYRDFLTYKIAKFVKDLDLDGLYHDHSRPWRCTNQHHGCTNSRRILAMRDLYKRIYTILRNHTKGKQTFMVAHILESLCPPVLSFSDAYVMCEPVRLMAVEHNDYLKKVDLDYFKSYCMGRQFGFVPMLLPGFRQDWSAKCREAQKRRGLKKWYFTQEFTDGTEKLCAILLLLDMTTAWPAWSDWRIPRRIWKVFDDYGVSTDDEVEFLPYWDNAKYVGATFKEKARGGEYPKPLVSIYNRRGKCALVAVANLTLEQRRVQVRLDLRALGLDPGRTKLVDAFYEPPLVMARESGQGRKIDLDNPYKDEPVQVLKGTVTLSIQPREFRLLGLSRGDR